MSAVGTRRRGERGAASAFVVGMAVTLLAVAGLVVDGGTALNARMRLADDVEQAARAGALEIDQDALRADQGVVTLDQGAASARARSYLLGLERGYQSGTVFVDDDEITVTANDTVSTQLLNLIGIDTFDVSATATAEAATE